MSVHSYSVYSIIERNARLFPDKTAVIDQEITLSFKSYLEQVNALAGGLAENGIKKNDRIAILSMNRNEYLTLYGAAAALGVIVVPLNWRLSEPELSYILKNSKSRFLFCDKQNLEKAETLINSDGVSAKLVCFDNVEKTSLPSWSTLLDAKPARQQPGAGDDVFCLIYTAAVEGNPRGAALSHNNIIFGNLQTSLTMSIDDKDAYINMLPMFHITGINLAFSVMHMGGKNVIVEKFNAGQVIDLIQELNVTVMASFPPILTTLMDEMEVKGVNCSSLTTVTGIDSPDNIAKFTQKTGSIFWVLYGQSETSGFVTLADSSETPGSAGKQCLISDVAILDDADAPVPAGTSGEICVKGPIIFQGYWKEDGFDTSSFRNGWHHTGDLGRIDGNGNLWFEGRKPEKELIKPGGENVYPAEVETVILQHPEIEATCVIGVPDPKFGEGVKAVCVRQEGSTLTEKALIEFVGSRIARYKKPGYVTFVDALPQTSAGKVDRQKVKARYSA